MGVAGPGLVILVPLIDRGIKVNLNEEIPGWQGLSKTELVERIKATVLNQPNAQKTG